ncbi:MAG: hypothetical protein ACREDD_06185 [Methylocella sp.]
MFGKAAVAAKIETGEARIALVTDFSLDTYRIFARYFAVNVWG